MSTHVVSVFPDPGDYADVLRPPTSHRAVEGGFELTFEPDLSGAEAAILTDIVSAVRLRTVRLTAAEYAAIRPHLQTLRDLRQLGRNAFLALTAAERDRMLYDAFTAQTIIDLALTRDG